MGVIGPAKVGEMSLTSPSFSVLRCALRVGKGAFLKRTVCALVMIMEVLDGPRSFRKASVLIGKPVILGDRLRPERSKKESQKGNEFPCQNASGFEGDVKKGTEPMLSPTDSHIDMQQQLAKKSVTTESMKTTIPVKKRGRPKGSKDKQKRLPKGFKQLKLIKNSNSQSDADWIIKARNMLTQNEGAAGEPKVIRKRGRPRGSKNKPVLPPLFYAEDFDEFDSDEKEDSNSRVVDAFYIPSEKREKFSLILEDINQRILGQAFQA